MATTTASLDQVKCVLDEKSSSLFLHVSGEDRPHLIAEVSQKLDRAKLYIASMTFNLHLSRQEIGGLSYVPYEMEILARGEFPDLQAAHAEISQHSIFESTEGVDHSERLFSIRHCSMFHLALYTPDQPGLIAWVSNEVSRTRKAGDQSGIGNFVHLLATTVNDGGPQGGTPYFSMRANVAVPNQAVGEAIVQGLHRGAAQRGIESDLWTCDLNKPA